MKNKYFLSNISYHKNWMQCFLLFSILCLVSCQGPKRWASRLDNTIYQTWVHSFEDDKGMEKVFRPNEYSFPPARGREGIEIERGGIVTYLAIGPVDVSIKYKGTWKMVNKNTMEIQIPEFSEVSKKLQILSVDKDRLVTIEE